MVRCAYEYESVEELVQRQGTRLDSRRHGIRHSAEGGRQQRLTGRQCQQQRCARLHRLSGHRPSVQQRRDAVPLRATRMIAQFHACGRVLSAHCPDQCARAQTAVGTAAVALRHTIVGGISLLVCFVITPIELRAGHRGRRLRQETGQLARGQCVRAAVRRGLCRSRGSRGGGGGWLGRHRRRVHRRQRRCGCGRVTGRGRGGRRWSQWQRRQHHRRCRRRCLALGLHSAVQHMPHSRRRQRSQQRVQRRQARRQQTMADGVDAEHLTDVPQRLHTRAGNKTGPQTCS
jgi:hypothetical protein